MYGLLQLAPEYDEVLVSNAALNCLSNVFIEQAVWIKGQCLPIMLSSYIGGFMALPYKVFFLFFGSSVLSFRLINAVLILLSLYFVYLATTKYLSKKVAVVVVFLLGFDFQFFYNVRLERTMVIPFLLRSLFLYFASLYLQKKQLRYLGIAGLVVGLSIWTKFDAVFFYVALLLGWSLTKLRSIRIDARLPQKVVVFYFGALLGLLPFLYYLRSSLSRFLFIGKEVAGNTIGDVLVPKAKNLFFQLLSFDAINYIFRSGYKYSSVEVVLALFTLLVLVFACIHAFRQKKLRFLVVSLLIFYLCYFLYGGLKFSHHRTLIYPIPQLILAFYLVTKRVWLAKLAPVVFLVIYIYSTVHFYQMLHTTPVTASFSQDIYSLGNYLSTQEGTVLIGDWGITNQLLLIDPTLGKYTEVAFAANVTGAEQLSPDVLSRLTTCNYLVLRKARHAIFINADRHLRSVIEGKLVYTDEIFEVYKCESN